MYQLPKGTSGHIAGHNGFCKDYNRKLDHQKVSVVSREFKLAELTTIMKIISNSFPL